jgi:hypothetical protein
VTPKLRDCLGTPFPDDASVGNCAGYPLKSIPPINALFMSHISNYFKNTKAEQEDEEEQRLDRVSYSSDLSRFQGPHFLWGNTPRPGVLTSYPIIFY